LTRESPGLGIPEWSPDDTRLLFASPAEDPRDLYIMNADGSNLHKVVSRANDKR